MKTYNYYRVAGREFYQTTIKTPKHIWELFGAFLDYQTQKQDGKEFFQQDAVMMAFASLFILSPDFYAEFLEINKHHPDIEKIKKDITELYFKTEHGQSQLKPKLK